MAFPLGPLLDGGLPGEAGVLVVPQGWLPFDGLACDPAVPVLGEAQGDAVPGVGAEEEPGAGVCVAPGLAVLGVELVAGGVAAPGVGAAGPGVGAAAPGVGAAVPGFALVLPGEVALPGELL